MARTWTIVVVASLFVVSIVAAQARELLVPLKFVPQESVRVTAVALPPSVLDRSVAVGLEDGRNLPDPATIGDGTNDDDEPFPIKASTDVVQFVNETVQSLAVARRLKIAEAPERRLNLRLSTFTVIERNKAIGSTYSAEVHFAYTLTDAEGRQLVEGAASGVANRYGRARSSGNCAEVLSDALKDAFTNTLADPRLQAAWSSGTPASAVSPAPAGAPAPASAPAPAGGAGTVEERLKRVDDLLKKGLISPEEHKALRSQILSSI